MLTSGLKLVVLFGLQDWMGDPQPRVMLPQLRDQVVGYKPNRTRESVQHDGHKGLEMCWYIIKEAAELLFLQSVMKSKRQHRERGNN